MDTAMFSMVVFFASSAISACLLYRCSRREEWRERWVWAIWGILGSLMFLSGFVSENLAFMVVGAMMAFANASAFLSSYVESEGVKRGLEALAAMVALGLFVYGYVVTESFILVVLVAFVLVALAVSYLLPRIRSKPESCN